MMMMNKAMPGISEQEIRWMREVYTKFGTQPVQDIGDAASYLYQNYGVSAQTLMGGLSNSDIGNIILRNAGSAQEASRSASSLMIAEAAMSNANMDSSGVMKLIEDIMTSDFVDMSRDPQNTAMLASLFSGDPETSFFSLKRDLEEGRIAEVVDKIMSDMGEKLSEDPTLYRNIFKSVGWDESFIRDVENYGPQVSSTINEALS